MSETKSIWREERKDFMHTVSTIVSSENGDTEDEVYETGVYRDVHQVEVYKRVQGGRVTL